MRREPSTDVRVTPGASTWICDYCKARQEPRRRCSSCGHRLLPPAPSKLRPVSIDSLAGRRRLPRLDSDADGRLHILGVHGGAGESTIVAAIPGAVEACGAWPVEPLDDDEPAHATPVILVARTHVHGLLAARSALEEWVAGDVDPVEVRGIVLVADAPGRLPSKVRELRLDVLHLAPRSWSVPYVRALRLCESALAAPPVPLARLSAQIVSSVRV